MISTRKLLRVTLLCLAASTTVSFTSGCETLPAPAVGADPYSIYPRVTATGGMNRILKVREAGVSIRNDDLLRVSIPVRNVASETKLVQYRFFFFNEDGTVHNTDPSWRRTRIAPGVEVFMTANSITAAENFRLEIRPQR